MASEVTLFRCEDQAQSDAQVTHILETVLEHHGVFPHEPSAFCIEIVGAAPTAALRSALTAAGFDVISETHGAVFASAPGAV